MRHYCIILAIFFIFVSVTFIYHRKSSDNFYINAFTVYLKIYLFFTTKTQQSIEYYVIIIGLCINLYSPTAASTTKRKGIKQVGTMNIVSCVLRVQCRIMHETLQVR